MILNSTYATSLRDNGSTATFDLETGGIEFDNSSSVCIVTAESFTAMNKIYNIDSNSNILEVGLYTSGLVVVSTIITINSGAYDIFTLVDALNTAFNDKFLVTFDSITGFVTIQPVVVTSNYGFFIISTTYTGMLKKLGFDTDLISILADGINTGFQDLNTSGSTVFYLTGTNLPDLFYPQMLYVCIDQIRTPNRVSLPYKEYGVILQEFAVEAGFGEIIHSRPNQTFEYHIPNLKTTNLTVRIIDQDGVPIQWNGGNWILVLWLAHGTKSSEDPSQGRTFRPVLKRTINDALTTSYERDSKRFSY